MFKSIVQSTPSFKAIFKADLRPQFCAGFKIVMHIIQRNWLLFLCCMRIGIQKYCKWGHNWSPWTTSTELWASSSCAHDCCLAPRAAAGGLNSFSNWAPSRPSLRFFTVCFSDMDPPRLTGSSPASGGSSEGRWEPNPDSPLSFSPPTKWSDWTQEPGDGTGPLGLPEPASWFQQQRAHNTPFSNSTAYLMLTTDLFFSWSLLWLLVCFALLSSFDV